MDKFDMSRNGIIHQNIIDFLHENNRNKRGLVKIGWSSFSKFNYFSKNSTPTGRSGILQTVPTSSV